MIPSDGNILLSYVNMKLRDEYSSLDDFCYGEDASQEEIEERLKAMGYVYSAEQNAFITAK